ncbi:MAG: hypothetical protein ABI823_15760, partial [Bryobacteraceae bacterium]
MLPIRIVSFALIAGVLPGLAADWSPRLAADYLDARQKAWFDWKPAARAGGPCLSCHTGLSYLLARPTLRAALGESKRTSYETGLADALRSRLSKADGAPEASKAPTPPPTGDSVESVLTALIFARETAPDGTLSADAQRAFDRMWSYSVQAGEGKGTWKWFNLTLDPWEMPESRFYGATLAAMAVGYAPEAYRRQAAVAARVSALLEYIRQEQASQPLHNRLMLLWASTKLPAALAESARRQVIEELLAKQEADGGWAIQSLGPFKEHADAPVSSGSNSYATALSAFILEQAGVSSTNPKVASALNWLRSHQDKQGYWDAQSMNKKYADPMPLLFMRDA